MVSKGKILILYKTTIPLICIHNNTNLHLEYCPSLAENKRITHIFIEINKAK